MADAQSTPVPVEASDVIVAGDVAGAGTVAMSVSVSWGTTTVGADVRTLLLFIHSMCDQSGNSVSYSQPMPCGMG